MQRPFGGLWPSVHLRGCGNIRYVWASLYRAQPHSLLAGSCPADQSTVRRGARRQTNRTVLHHALALVSSSQGEPNSNVCIALAPSSLYVSCRPLSLSCTVHRPRSSLSHALIRPMHTRRVPGLFVVATEWQTAQVPASGTERSGFDLADL